MEHTARNAAVEALLQVEKNEGYSNIVIDKVLKAYKLNRRDRGLASTLFYGVLERKITLDYYLQSCLREPSKKMDQEVAAVLRTAAYQIFYLDKVPAPAVVNEAVETVKAIGKRSASGFVNGVLRTLLRKRENLKLPDSEDVAGLSVRYSIPASLLLLWQGSYGIDCTKRILEAFQERPPLYIRINTVKTDFEGLSRRLSEEGVQLLPSGLFPEAAVLEGCGSPAELSVFHEGLFHVQDLSAQLICHILAPRPGAHICDCCAAPGGKTFTLAEIMGDRGKITALDLYKGRVGLIRSGAQRLGLTIVEAGVNDALQGFSKIEKADYVLCDVPCSGYGVIRRKPEIRYKDVSMAAQLPRIQRNILQNAACLVKPGGVLLYATCTLNPAENNQVAQCFLEENNGFEPMEIDLPTPVCRVIDEPAHMVTMMPFAGASDGFFAALFRKKAG